MNEALKTVKLDGCGAVMGGFGKYEVELAAGRLVEFLRTRSNYGFTFKELTRFYEEHQWNPDEMLFGLLGVWLDDGPMERVEGPPYVVHMGRFLMVTGEFLERVRKGSAV